MNLQNQVLSFLPTLPKIESKVEHSYVKLHEILSELSDGTQIEVVFHQEKANGFGRNSRFDKVMKKLSVDFVELGDGGYGLSYTIDKASDNFELVTISIIYFLAVFGGTAFIKDTSSSETHKGLLSISLREMHNDDYYMTSLASQPLAPNYRLGTMGTYLTNKYSREWKKDSGDGLVVWEFHDTIPAHLFMKDINERAIVMQRFLFIAGITDASEIMPLIKFA